MRPPTGLLLILSITGLLSLATSRGQVAASSPIGCSAHPDTASLALGLVREMFTLNDSASLVRAGLPYKPTTLTLVTTTAICDSIIARFNASLTGGDTVYRVTSGYVVSALSAYGLYLPPPNDSISGDVAAFDSTYAHRLTQTVLR